MECSFDPLTVVVDSGEKEKEFTNTIKGHIEGQLPRLSTEDTKAKVWGSSVITCHTVGIGVAACCIWVSQPMFTSKVPTGQLTRGYWGIQCKLCLSKMSGAQMSLEWK